MNRGTNYLLIEAGRLPNRGDYILGAVGIVGCVVILILNLMGVA